MPMNLVALSAGGEISHTGARQRAYGIRLRTAEKKPLTVVGVIWLSLNSIGLNSLFGTLHIAMVRETEDLLSVGVVDERSSVLDQSEDCFHGGKVEGVIAAPKHQELLLRQPLLEKFARLVWSIVKLEDCCLLVVWILLF